MSEKETTEGSKTYRCKYRHCHCLLSKKGYCSDYCEDVSNGLERCQCDHESCKPQSGLVTETNHTHPT